MRAGARGLAAGLGGTATMDVFQTLVHRLQHRPCAQSATQPADPWERAPAPAQAARKLLRVLGIDPPPERIPLLANMMHWSYGASLGIAFAVIRGRLPRRTEAAGIAFGSAVWAASYAQLVPLGIYRPPWRYPLKTIALDVAYHVAFGLAAAATYDALADRAAATAAWP